MRKVIFLDRDGVVNVERGEYTFKIEDFKFVDGLFSSLKILKQKGFEFIIITNQGGISKNIYSLKDVLEVHGFMREQFEKNQIPLLDIYYCPHHHEIEKCICRKPNSLMLEKAIAKHKINISQSYFIGDSGRDIVAAQKVDIQGIKIRKNENFLIYLEKYIE